MSIAITAFGLAKRYRSGGRELTVFAGLDLQIERGEAVAIVGQSGAGKSTLLHLLGGLDRPTEGRVLFGDTDIFSLDDDGLANFRNRRLGFVWQQNSLLPEFTAAENVAMPLLIAGENRKRALARAGERLAEVGLEDRGHHRAGEMSGGEQQRTALARALIQDPEVLLADEPTGNLDPVTAEGVFGLLERLRASRGLTSVIVTHSRELAERCPHVIKLEKGGLAIPATPNGLAGTAAGAQSGWL